MTIATKPRLQPNEVPLVLLASVALPDAEIRRSLARRLDMASDEDGCQLSSRAWRAFFLRQDRHRRASVVPLGRTMRELAVRIARLVFSDTSSSRNAKLMIAHQHNDGTNGYLVDHHQKVINLGGSSVTRHRQNRQQSHCRFLAGPAHARLIQFRKGEPPVQAVCRVEDRFVLELTGELPWTSRPVEVLRCSRLGSVNDLATLGFKQEFAGKTLRLFPHTPEAILRFSAALMRGEVMHISNSGTPGNLPRGRQADRSGRILVRLLDFAGDQVRMAVLVSNNRADSWLQRVPPPAITLTCEERLAIARWAWPLDSWMTPEFVEKLI